MKDVFAQRLIARLEAVGVSKAEIARRLGVSRSTMTMFCQEGEEALPSVRTLAALAKALNTSCDYLLGLTDDPSAPTAEKLRLPQQLFEAALADARSTVANLSAGLLGAQAQAQASAEADARLDTGPLQATDSPAARILRAKGAKKTLKANGDTR